MMMTVTLGEQVARQLTKVANERDLSPDQLVEKAIRDRLRAELDCILAREMDTFRHLHPMLLQQYPKQYVGIRQGQLIDHDVDQLTLYLRLEEQYPDEVILIKQVCPATEEVYTFRFTQAPHE